MEAVAQAELFPVLEEKVRKRSPLWQYLAATAKRGPLATPAMVAASIGVSRQRVHQLMNDGRLPFVHMDGGRLIPVHELEQFLLVERRSGIHAEYHVPESYSEFWKRYHDALKTS